MSDAHPLKTLLHVQLATDNCAALHLPYVLTYLTPNAFILSSHLPKWTARIHSLIHSKEPAARWAGLSLAWKSSTCSKEFMKDNAHSWVPIALPLLARNEALPTLKAAIRLLRHIFIQATDIPEFQRQVATPNVPKFSNAIIAMANSTADASMQSMILETLGTLIPLYPTLHRPVHPSLSSLCLKYLNGKSPAPEDFELAHASARLYSVLHLTGGKVAAANMWRKSVDETIQLAWTTLGLLQSSFLSVGAKGRERIEIPSEEAPLSIPFHLNRLRCTILLLQSLLRSFTARPVLVPLGSLTSLALALINCTAEETPTEYVDPTVRAMQTAIVPSLWQLGCDVTTSIITCTSLHALPSYPRLLTSIICHLEKDITPSQRLVFLRTLGIALSSLSPHQAILTGRLMKATLPSLAIVLPSRLEAITNDQDTSKTKGKKRARGYEGNELFKTAREVICPKAVDGQVLLAAVEVVHLLLTKCELPPATRSLGTRLILGLSLALTQMPPSTLSPDPALHPKVLSELHRTAVAMGVSTQDHSSKSLGLVISILEMAPSDNNMTLSLQQIDLALHPRVPPLLKSQPHVEVLALFRAEESKEEAGIRKKLGIEVQVPPHEEDVTMQVEPISVETLAPAQAPVIPAPSQPVPAVTPTVPLQPPPLSSTGTPTLSNTTPQLQNSMTLPTIAPPPMFSQNKAAVVDEKQAEPPAGVSTKPSTLVLPQDEDDEDEEMPTINMESDSDDE